MAEDRVNIFIEHGEEIPTGSAKRVKVVELPVFGYDDKRRIDNLVEKIEAIINEMESGKAGKKEKVSSELLERLDDISAEISGLRSAATDDVRTSINDLSLTMQANEERVVSSLGRAVENMESLSQSLSSLNASMELFGERISEIDKKLDEKLYSLDSSVNYSKGVVIEAADKISSAADESGRKFTLLVEGINEKFDAHISSLNARIENLALQVLDPMNDMSLRLDTLRKSVDALKSRKTTIKMSLPTTAFQMLAEAKKKIRGKRVPKNRQAEKRRLLESVDAIEQRVLDIFIFSALGTKRLSASVIKKEIPVAQSKVPKRISQLVASGRLVRTKKGRYFVFSAA